MKTFQHKQTTSLILTILVIGSNILQSQNILKDIGPGTYKILINNNDTVIIPFNMHNGKPLMDLKINGKNAKLMIDNGVLWDQVWLFGSPLVDTLKLKPVTEGSIGGQGEGDPTVAFTSSDLTLNFNDIIFLEQPVLVSPPATGFYKMFPGADGQLCNTFFKHFIVQFDFIRNRILLLKPDKFQFKGDGSVIDMKENSSGTYSVPFSLEIMNGKTYNGNVDIDFGGIYPLKVALNNKNNICLPADAIEEQVYGAQGKISDYSGKIKSFSIGKYKFNNPTVFFGDEKTSRIFPDNLGVIGLPLFMRFNITFDYFNNKIYLEPNANFERPFN